MLRFTGQSAGKSDKNVCYIVVHEVSANSTSLVVNWYDLYTVPWAATRASAPLLTTLYDEPSVTGSLNALAEIVQVLRFQQRRDELVTFTTTGYKRSLMLETLFKDFPSSGQPICCGIHETILLGMYVHISHEQ